MLTPTQREKMALYVRSYILRSAENFGHRNAAQRASARWTHTLNVVKNVQLITSGEVSGDDLHMVCETAAMFHDIDHYTVQLEYHAQRGAETATRWLTKEGYDAGFVKRVATIVRNHHMDLDDDVPVDDLLAQIDATRNYETRVVMDADTLDKIGVSNLLQSVITLTLNGKRLGDVAKELTSGWPLQRASLWKQLLTTRTGKALGEERYQFYEAALRQIATEIVIQDPYPLLTQTQEFAQIAPYLPDLPKRPQA
jgi:predicted metal-dependent HD superfamily phosphohydrolase